MLTPTPAPSPELKEHALLGKLRSRPVVRLPKWLCTAPDPLTTYRRVVALPGEHSRNVMPDEQPVFGILTVPPVPIDTNETPLLLQP